MGKERRKRISGLRKAKTKATGELRWKRGKDYLHKEGKIGKQSYLSKGVRNYKRPHMKNRRKFAEKQKRTEPQDEENQNSSTNRQAARRKRGEENYVVPLRGRTTAIKERRY